MNRSKYSGFYIILRAAADWSNTKYSCQLPRLTYKSYSVLFDKTMAYSSAQACNADIWERFKIIYMKFPIYDYMILMVRSWSTFNFHDLPPNLSHYSLEILSIKIYPSARAVQMGIFSKQNRLRGSQKLTVPLFLWFARRHVYCTWGLRLCVVNYNPEGFEIVVALRIWQGRADEERSGCYWNLTVWDPRSRGYVLRKRVVHRCIAYSWGPNYFQLWLSSPHAGILLPIK